MEDSIRRLDRSNLDTLIEKSHLSPRKRSPTPLQSSEYTGPQCLINPMQPDSYVQPHRHSYEEIWMPIQGRFILGLFDENGNPIERVDLSKNHVLYFRVPGNVYHSVLSLEQDSVFFNITQGPFDQKAAKDFAPWAPREASNPLLIKDYLQDLREKLFNI